MSASITSVLLMASGLLASGLKLQGKVSVNTKSNLGALMMKSQMICSKNYWLTMNTCVKPYNDGTTFVRTGDIEYMWIRDSAAQMHPYIPLAQDSQQFRDILEGALRSQAKFIAIDPYANAYGAEWKDVHGNSNEERLVRGGYVRTANFELDDGPYFFRFLKTYTDAVPSSKILAEPQMHEAAKMLIDLFKFEQNHEHSGYNYPLSGPWELPNGPRGAKTAYTGMVWNGFRPSDDAHTYAYHIPDNLFLAAYLPFVSQTARSVWRDETLAARAEQLRRDILQGVEKHGTKVVDGEKIYCYETDGLGNCNLMDDANVPSLLSIPYLDPSGDNFDKEIYKNTRKWVLSEKNPWFFSGKAGRGIGSPHTGHNRIWPMSIVMEALTTDDKADQDKLLQMVIDTSARELLHESFHKDNHEAITREWFAWPNALFAELVRSKGGDCGSAKYPPVMPKVKPAPRNGPLARMSAKETFYTAPVEQLRYRPLPNPTAWSK